MEVITIDEFLKQQVPSQTSISRQALEAAALRKRNGARCASCGGRIWALGSAAAGTDMCFSCITGEADSSEDFEITL